MKHDGAENARDEVARKGKKAPSASLANAFGLDEQPTKAKADVAPTEAKKRPNAALASVFGGEEEPSKPSAAAAAPPRSRHRGKIGANMAAYMRELQDRQTRLERVMTDSTAAPDAADTFSSAGSGSHDTGDPTTTNLYVGNLAPTVTEELLEEEFSRYGDVYSVKIMWPRTDEERARQRNCGFVCYCDRPDAEDALRNLADKVIHGQPMVVGWGKKITMRGRGLSENKVPRIAKGAGGSVPVIGEAALEALAKAKARNEALLSGDTSHGDAAGASTPDVPGLATQGLDLENMIRAALPRVAIEETEPGPNDSIQSVQIPFDGEARTLINLTAKYVATDGKAFEDAIRSREQGNPRFRFLFDHKSPEGMYYAWRVASYALGDTEYKWRTTPFQIVRNGLFLRPPPIEKGLENTDVELREAMEKDRRRQRERDERRRQRQREEAEMERELVKSDSKIKTGAQLEKSRRKAEKRLRSEDLSKLRRLLESLTLSRQKIKEVMGFCLDKAEAGEHIIGEVFNEFVEPPAEGVEGRREVSSLPRKELTPNMLLSRLYLVSDILYNSSAPVKNSWRFRENLESYLPRMMEVTGEFVKNASRLTADGLKSKIEALLNVWNRWSLYSASYMTGLQYSFLAEGMGDVPDVVKDVEETSEERGIGQEAGRASTGDQPMPAAEEDEQVRRKARRLGVRCDNALSTSEVKRRVEAVKKYAAAIEEARRARLREINPDITFDSENDDASDEDLDGAPVEDDSGMVRNAAEAAQPGEEAGQQVLAAGQGTWVTDIPGSSANTGNVNGEELDGEELDGEEIDGEEIDGEDLDGEDLDGEDIDGEDIDGEAVDGEAIPEDDVDGEAIL
eukprot:scaffold427_cov263-Pinguiococcus_pyrenoidosus.AAC.4